MSGIVCFALGKNYFSWTTPTIVEVEERASLIMPAVASVPKELYLSSSLKDLNKKTEVKPEKTSTKKCVHFASLIKALILLHFLII